MFRGTSRDFHVMKDLKKKLNYLVWKEDDFNYMNPFISVALSKLLSGWESIIKAYSLHPFVVPL